MISRYTIVYELGGDNWQKLTYVGTHKQAKDFAQKMRIELKLYPIKIYLMQHTQMAEEQK